MISLDIYKVEDKENNKCRINGESEKHIGIIQ